jgi:hypothetical protein
MIFLLQVLFCPKASQVNSSSRMAYRRLVPQSFCHIVASSEKIELDADDLSGLSIY